MGNRKDIGNQLLAALSGEDFARLERRMSLVSLPRGQVLYEAGAEVDTVWLPESGLISLISVMLSGDSIETSVVGCEGGVGFIEAAGSGVMFSRAMVQMPGRSWRIPASVYREALDASPGMRRVVQDHIELLITESRQAIACMGLHQVEQRLARWLLEAQDRSGGADRLPLTQELLSVMLGVQRTTVSAHAARLQAEGAIRYSRGMIEIIDRGGVERHACECYATNHRFRAMIEARPGRG